MSLNQVIAGTDEIITGTPEYTLTEKQNGNYDIQLANEVAHEGTNLNKSLLDKIDNVLSYLTPSVEKVGIVEYEETTYQNQFTLDNNGVDFVNNQRVLLETPNDLDLDGVDSNTLNGIDIPTLLQPSTKYELIYNEDTNKFVFGNLTETQPLFDITLTEAVNRVDLTGLYSKMKIGKIYDISILGTTTTETQIMLGATAIYSTVSGANFRIPSPLLFGKISDGIITYQRVYTTPTYMFITIDNNEYIKCGTNSVKFNVGTRIIIKEVA